LRTDAAWCLRRCGDYVLRLVPNPPKPAPAPAASQKKRNKNNKDAPKSPTRAAKGSRVSGGTAARGSAKAAEGTATEELTKAITRRGQGMEPVSLLLAQVGSMLRAPPAPPPEPEPAAPAAEPPAKKASPKPKKGSKADEKEDADSIQSEDEGPRPPTAAEIADVAAAAPPDRAGLLELAAMLLSAAAATLELQLRGSSAASVAVQHLVGSPPALSALIALAHAPRTRWLAAQLLERVSDSPNGSEALLECGDGTGGTALVALYVKGALLVLLLLYAC